MHPADHDAAKAIRRSLSSAGVAPPSFRAALDEVEPPDRPAIEMQREAKFQETVFYIRDLITKLEEGRT